MTNLAEPVYVHCRKCISEEAETRIEVATDGWVVEVWCQVHDEEIATFELQGNITR